MKLLTLISICLLFLTLQSTAIAAKPIQDKQLLQAYNLLVKQPAKKYVATTSVAAKKATHRTPQTNAVLIAKKQINKKYRWGGTNPYSGFDCSGLIQYAYKASSVHLPRTTAEQYKHTKRVSMKNLKVGDLIFFKTRRSRARVNHAGIYLGGNKFIHAPRRGKLVSVTDLNSYWRKKVVGAGRV